MSGEPPQAEGPEQLPTVKQLYMYDVVKIMDMHHKDYQMFRQVKPEAPQQ